MNFNKGHTGVCHLCGRPHTEPVHEHCGTKVIDDPQKAARARSKYKGAAKRYQKGQLPWWMFR